MREWGAEAVTFLVKAALYYKPPNNMKDNKVNSFILPPLSVVTMFLAFLFCSIDRERSQKKFLGEGLRLCFNVV